MADEFRERLVNFYAFYNPSCVNSVDAIMATYKDREEDLMRVLVAKYGPEPSNRPSVSVASSAIGVDLERVGYWHASGISGSNSRRNTAYETALEVLANQRTTEPATDRRVDIKIIPSAERSVSPAARYQQPEMSWRARFHNFFTFHCPEKIPFLDEKLSRHAGREPEWMSNLVKKYGPEPSLRAASSRGKLAAPSYSSLKSPSPPPHPTHQPIMAQLVEVPTENKKSTQKEKDEGGLEGIIFRLTEALELKSRELLDLKGAKRVLEDQVNEYRDKEAEFSSRVSTLTSRLGAKELELTSTIQDKSNLEKRIFDLEAQHQQLLTESEKLSRSVALREHQQRLLRSQIDQGLSELSLREKHVAELSTALKSMHQVNSDLVKEVGALRLALTEPSSEVRFFKVVEEIQESSEAAFNNRRRILETEMQQYYEYAKQQISHRDDTINQLTEQLARLSGSVFQLTSQTAAPETSTSHSGEHHLAEEVAKLKLQLTIQQEEFKALLASRARYSREEHRTPPKGNAESELRKELKRTQEEAQAAKSALQAELGRQVEDMRDVQHRVEQYENEKAHLFKAIEELQAHSNRPHSVDTSSVWALVSSA